MYGEGLDMQAIAESKFRQIREGLFVSREDVVRRTKSVSLGTIRNAELGRPIRRTNALQLLDAINSLLADSNKPVVSMDELGIRLY